jgi:hypothetical protein
MILLLYVEHGERREQRDVSCVIVIVVHMGYVGM